jgi:hypothetical protein
LRAGLGAAGNTNIAPPLAAPAEPAPKSKSSGGQRAPRAESNGGNNTR